jgi:hypothetical protein
MTYFEDLSVYRYFPPFQPDVIVRNVGWLDASHEFSRHTPTAELLDALWDYCSILVESTRGVHDCEFCADPRNTFERHSVRRLLGTGEIRVFGPAGDVFAAPNLIYHYVSEHEYRPPLEFLRALEQGPRPGTEQYSRLLDNLRVSWRENPPRLGELRTFRVEDTEAGPRLVEVKRRD